MTKIWTPLILVNFKTYIEGVGSKALKLAENAQKISDKTGVCIGLAPQLSDIVQLSKVVSLPLFVQHVDPITPGRHTGFILPEAIKKAGASGSLINHSEHRLQLAKIDAITCRLRNLELISVICANNAQVSAAVASLEPNFIAIEPPELIGTGIPVSKAKPEVITETLNLVKKANPEVKILCGAGITKGEDVLAALNLGTKGVLVASGIVKAKDNSKVLLEFAEASREF